MTNMRLRLKYKGMEFKHPYYFWAGEEWCEVLLDSDLSIGGLPYIFSDPGIFLGYSYKKESLLCTERFLFPLGKKSIMVLDGAIYGSVRFRLSYTEEFGDCYNDDTIYISKLGLLLKTITAEGIEKKIAEGEAHSYIILRPAAHTYSKKFTVDVPYSFNVKTKKVHYGERLLLEMRIYGGLGGDETASCRRLLEFMFSATSDYFYIDIPVV